MGRQLGAALVRLGFTAMTGGSPVDRRLMLVTDDLDEAMTYLRVRSRL